MLHRLRLCAFPEEYRQTDQFAASSMHTYYVVRCTEEPECLLKVLYSDLPGEDGRLLRKADLSFGRIAKVPAHYGWQYLKVFIDRIMVSQRPFLVVSRLKSKGGRKAFEQFQQDVRNRDSTCYVLIAETNSSAATGYISNDQATVESICSISVQVKLE